MIFVNKKVILLFLKTVLFKFSQNNQALILNKIFALALS